MAADRAGRNATAPWRMTWPVLRRRRFGLLLAAVAAGAHAQPRPSTVFTLTTFGDSILDCGHYNPHGVHPGQLLVHNDDKLFPDFQGRDLQALRQARLDHRAVDGATVSGLASQARGLPAEQGPGVVILTVGGNDLLQGLAADTGAGVRRFETQLRSF